MTSTGLALKIFGANVLIALVCSADPPGGFYTTRYDHIDVENILNQKRLVYYYAACLLDRGPCTPQGIEFKRILPEALRTNCLRCTEKQRFVTMKSIKRLKKEYPDVWGQLAEIWDPTGEYFVQLEESVNKRNNKVPEAAILSNRIGSENEVTASITERVVTTTMKATTTTTPKPKITTTTTERTTTTKRTSSPTAKRSVPTTKRITTTTTLKMLSSKEPSTTIKKIIGISYNYDFAATTKPVIRPQQPVAGFNIVLRGVNNIIAPITDIAGKVITAGTDLASMVLDVLGVRRN